METAEKQQGSSFAERCAAVFSGMAPGFTAVLATHSGAEISARTMSVLLHGHKFYFQTDGTSGKVRQLQQCPQAALAFDKYQVRGRCVSLGHPMQEDNREIYTLFAAQFPGASRKYSHLEQEKLFCLEPASVRIWRYTDAGAVIEELDLQAGSFIRRSLGY